MATNKQVLSGLVGVGPVRAHLNNVLSHIGLEYGLLLDDLVRLLSGQLQEHAKALRGNALGTAGEAFPNWQGSSGLSS